MKKLLFLALLAFTSCSKDDDSQSYLRANFAGQDLVKSATKIEKKYNHTKDELEVWFYTGDSSAIIYHCFLSPNVCAVVNADLRVKYKKYSTYEYTTGRLTKENNKVSGTLYTNKFGGAIEFKNYQL